MRRKAKGRGEWELGSHGTGKKKMGNREAKKSGNK
jgi:hypothetical protein